jgi:predicted N-acetyltransferase YhbS
MWQIRPERESDSAGVDALVDLGFGPGRFAKTAYRLREGVAPEAELSFVAEDLTNRALLGSVRFWPVRIGNQRSLLLGPLAVKPELRGQGIGIALMQAALLRARRICPAETRTIALSGPCRWRPNLGSRAERRRARFAHRRYRARLHR